MIESVNTDMERWTHLGVTFGHVAVNAAAAEFRIRSLAEKLLERLAKAKLSGCCLQLEVTDRLFSCVVLSTSKMH